MLYAGQTVGRLPSSLPESRRVIFRRPTPIIMGIATPKFELRTNSAELTMSFFARLLSVNALFAACMVCAGSAWAQQTHSVITNMSSIDTAVPELVLAESAASGATQLATIKSASSAPEVMRSRHVALDHSVLKSLRADASAARPESIRISLFDDTA